MDALSSFVSRHAAESAGKDVRLTATDTGDGIQLHGKEKPDWVSMQFKSKSEDFDRAQQAVKNAIAQINIPNIDNEAIKTTLMAILDKKMEDSYLFGSIKGHKNSLSMEALHSITAAYESLIKPDVALEKAIAASTVTFVENTPSHSKQVATNYAECLERLDDTRDLISKKIVELENYSLQKGNLQSSPLMLLDEDEDQTLDLLEEQREKLDEIKDVINRQISSKTSKDVDILEQSNVQKYNTLFDKINDVVGNKIDLEKLSTLEQIDSEDDEFSIQYKPLIDDNSDFDFDDDSYLFEDDDSKQEIDTSFDETRGMIDEMAELMD